MPSAGPVCQMRTILIMGLALLRSKLTIAVDPVRQACLDVSVEGRVCWRRLQRVISWMRAMLNLPRRFALTLRGPAAWLCAASLALVSVGVVVADAPQLFDQYVSWDSR